MIKPGKEQEFRDYLEKSIADLKVAIKAGGVAHEVLNARQHAREAFIVAQAGVPGAVTIATNMAGRGTDIKLGGNVEMRVAQELGEMEEGKARTAKEEAIAAEARGETQKVRITNHLADMIQQELVNPEGFENPKLGLIQVLNHL